MQVKNIHLILYRNKIVIFKFNVKMKDNIGIMLYCALSFLEYKFYSNTDCNDNQK